MGKNQNFVQNSEMMEFFQKILTNKYLNFWRKIRTYGSTKNFRCKYHFRWSKISDSAKLSPNRVPKFSFNFFEKKFPLEIDYYLIPLVDQEKVNFWSKKFVFFGTQIPKIITFTIGWVVLLLNIYKFSLKYGKNW